jgi:predicted DNA-binding transcriptional regulator YafY
VVSKRARDVSEKSLDATLGSGFGIFSGRQTETAILQFNPKRARWVSREHWHSQQEGDFELDGSYLLRVPYSDPRELIMDILKYGPDVKVLGPETLVAAVKEQIKVLNSLYSI